MRVPVVLGAIVLLSLVPAPPAEAAGALPHAPIRIVGDAGFLAPGSGVVGGSGTAEDPYRIEGWAFAVPAFNAVLSVGAPDESQAAISIEGTTAHVLVRGNLFVAAPSVVPAPSITGLAVPLESAPGVALRSVENVRVEDNAFRNVGGALGAVSVRPASSVDSYPEYLTGDLLGGPSTPSRAVRIAGNEFLGGNRPAVAVVDSQADVVGNTIRMAAWNCCIHYAHIELDHVVTPVLVEDNDIVSGYGSPYGQGSVGIDLDQTADGGLVVVRGNRISGTYVNGISLSASTYINDGEGGSLLVEDNEVDGEWTCLSAYAAGGGTVRRNRLDGCETGLVVDHGLVVEDTNTVDGRRAVQLKGVQDVVVDGTGAGWLQAIGLRNVTLRNFHLGPSAGTTFIDGNAVTLEDSSFSAPRKAPLQVGGADPTLRRVRAETGTNASWAPTAIDLFAAGTVRLEDVETVRGWRGVRVWKLYGASAVHVEVERGTFRDAGTGLFAGRPGTTVDIDGARFVRNQVGLGAESTAAVTATGASFLGNSLAGARAAATATIDARGSWWGDPSGPRAPSNPDGLGDAVEGPILFDPWLTTAP